MKIFHFEPDLFVTSLRDGEAYHRSQPEVLDQKRVLAPTLCNYLYALAESIGSARFNSIMNTHLAALHARTV